MTEILFVGRFLLANSISLINTGIAQLFYLFFGQVW